MIKTFIHILIGLSILGFVSCSSTKQSTEEQSALPKEAPRIKQVESTALMIDAARQKMLQNWTHATVLYSEALMRDPRNTAAMFELAKIHAEKGYFADAYKYISTAILLEPENIYYLQTLADIYFLQNKNEKALGIKREIARKNLENLNLQLELFGTLMLMKKHEEALQQITHIDTLMGFNAEVSMQKQNLYVLLGRMEDAIEEAKKLVDVFPNEISFLEVLAELYMESSRDDEAYTLFQEMIELEPNNPMVRLQLADYYRKNQNEEKAFEQITFAFQSSELNIDGKHRILMSFFIMGEDKEEYDEMGYALARILVEVHPDDAYSQALYGDFLFRDKKYERAKEQYLKTVDLEPSELNFWQQILYIDSQLEDYHSMKDVSERALDYFFEQPILYLFNGIAHLQLKDYEEAVNAFNWGKDLVINNDKLLTQFYTLLGDSYFKTEDKQASFRSYESALQVNPNNTFALNNYSYYLALEKERLDFALEMAAEVNRLEPENAAYQDTFGWVKYQMGNYEEAKKWIEKALKTAEEPSASIFEHYGDVLYKLGQKEQALKYWIKAEEQGGETSEFLPRKIKEKTLYE